MFNHKKTAAFIMSLVLCASAAAPVCSAYAHGDHSHDTTETVEETTDTVTDTESEAAATETANLVSGEYEYQLLDDETVSFEGYTGSDTAIVIPETIDGKTVTKISAAAFKGSEDAVSVHIPAGVKTVDECFSVCPSLKEITVDEANEIFYAVDGVLYSESGDYGAIIHCYPQAKEGASFTIPDSVKFIGAAALYNTKLEEIKLPAGLDSLYHHGFSSNLNLTSIDMSGCTELTSIGDMAFAYCEALTDVKLPPQLGVIGGGAFAACASLTDIELPQTLSSVGQNAFAGTGLTIVTIPESVFEIGYCAFGYDVNLEPISDFVIIGATGSAAETYCTEVDEEYGYENNFTFYDESDADMVMELDGLEQIVYGDYTYAEKDGEAWILVCTSADDVIEIPAEINGLPVTRIYGGAFFQIGALEIIVPDSVKQIDSLAFYCCSLLKKITLPASLETIGDEVFVDCTALQSVTIPEGCKSIGTDAFSGCTALSSIIIPDGCETIGMGAFINCSALTSFTVPSGCTSIGEDAFYGCTALKEFVMTGSADGAYAVEEGVLFNKDKSVLVAYPAAKEGDYYAAPTSVKEIAMSAFAANKFLKTVDISTAETIGAYAFEFCETISSVKLSQDLLKIGEGAFYGCTSLKSMRLYNKIQEIGSYAIGFYYDEANSTDAEIEGFMLYAEENSGGAQYALKCELDCEYDVSKYVEAGAPKETVKIFGAEVEKNFLYVTGGIAGAVVLAAAGIFTGKKLKKNKEEKEIQRKKEEIEKKLAAKKAGRKENENENK